jgi:hypothetical protein
VASLVTAGSFGTSFVLEQCEVCFDLLSQVVVHSMSPEDIPQSAER